MKVVKKGFESVLQLRCTVYIMKETFYCAIRKIMSSHVNDQSVYSVQNECPLICKALPLRTYCIYGKLVKK